MLSPPWMHRRTGERGLKLTYNRWGCSGFWTSDRVSQDRWVCNGCFLRRRSKVYNFGHELVAATRHGLDDPAGVISHRPAYFPDALADGGKVVRRSDGPDGVG